ncbi:nucleoside hydrolase [Candidatus Poribacteria bacterium]|nr:nucleoside hydrolase [Candidatus Poribacteria bacterium]
MQRILLDTDTGVDDALAIILALNSPELKVEAITTVSGNVHVDLCARNLLMTLEAMEIGGSLAPSCSAEPAPIEDRRASPSVREYPIVAKGESQPLVKPLVTAAHVHGSDGLGDVTKLLTADGARRYPEPQPRLAAIAAVDLIIDRVGQYPDELILVPVGPLTNIAKAMIKNPARMRKIKAIVLMGGAFETYGNVTATAEFNIFVDPHAAQLVLDFGVPITIMPLDATHQVRLTGERLNAEIGERNDKLSQFLRDATRVCMEFHRQYEGFYGFYLHDPLTIGLLTHPTLFETVDAFVQVETSGDLTQGMTIADLRPGRPRPKPNARVCVGVKAEEFLQHFFKRILPISL